MDLDQKRRRSAVLFAFVIFIFYWAAYSVFSVPRGSGKNLLVEIETGDGLREIADQLKADGIIKSAFLFKTLTFLAGNHKNIKAGEYFFDAPLSVFEVALRMSQGVYGLSPTRITIVEGWTAWQMGGYLEERGFFPRQEWMKYAGDKEGYLFPDTYFFLPNTPPEKIIEAMNNNFEKKVAEEFRDEIVKQGREFEDVLIMASIIEREMSSYEDGRIISGILWKRLDEGIGLQVDAALGYVTGKSSGELTASDLAMDSPYNTYKFRGLPPTPIGNPGLNAIMAAIYPEATSYWFYLHGKDKEPRYAVTFEDHVANKRKYLR